MTASIRTLVVDDEPAARRRIVRLGGAHPDVRIVGEAGTAADAIELLESASPDLVFLDIRLPEGDGFEVVDALAATPARRRRPAVVFVTAFSEHAPRAFDVHAVDYLMKPFSPERFNTALDRVREHLGRTVVDDPEPRVASRRLPIEVDGRVLLLDTEHIDYIRAERNYVRIHTGDETHRVRGSLSAMEHKLDPTRFCRIHRSLIVALDRIEEVETLDHGELALRLRSGAILISGRTYTAALRSALGLTGASGRPDAMRQAGRAHGGKR